MRPRIKTRKTVIAAAVLLVATVVTGLYLGVQTRRQFLEISESWTGYSSEADRKGALISAIRGQLGYGGIIHTFKNYVLRQDDQYRQRLVGKLGEFDAVTAEYLALPISVEEREAVETVIRTIAIYRDKLSIAEAAAAERWSAERTDALVRVDDTDALAALATLERLWQAARTQQTERLFASVERGRGLIGIGFVSMALLVLASLSLALAFRSILADMQGTLDQLSDELDLRHRLERSEQRLAQAVEQSPASVMITDTDGRLKYVNRHFEELSGWSRDEVIGETPKFLQSGDTEAAEYARMQELLRDGKSWRGILHNLRKDGGSYWIESTILPLREADGTTHSYLGIGEDITERLRAREQMARAQKIEAVGLLAGGIAHDFNSVLTSILGSAHLAALDAPQGSDLAREVEQIEIAARRAQLLVQQLLGFARRKAGNPVPTDMREVVRQVMRLARASTAPTTRFVVSDAEEPVWVAADPTHLHQIVMNLCGNAAEAIGGKGGTVRVWIDTDHNPDDAGAGMCLTVRDDGPGMTEDVRRRVFDAFFTTKPMGKGTGLGLAVVHGLVSDIGGTIEVDSQPGQGAEFRVRLPLCHPPDQKADGTAEAMPYGTERLLVVDDEPEIAATLRRSLTRYGYRVEAFSSAPVALQSFESAPDRFDAAITDVVMPDMNGAELAARLRVVRPSLPILFLTGFAPHLDRIDGPEPMVVSKPVDPLELARILRQHLDRS
ncbi:PAS domain S-box protein [Thalassococcus sp. CAU 1522]|uniref:histidine kinase n=1 Tax=Thalassococcus arenae TaxID=2851652 RepID=A0ABS6N4I1_9RHOB|nr:ATP-binding protein [Thalassococcus arenae]MBV2358425.1 PAS domain S-box protein [Thalassococcus arenae]